MAHGDWLDANPVAPAVCPGPMLRSTLLGLRAANALDTDCAYVVTDHIQTRLVGGTTITMRAVSANELSEQVEVNTGYDNEAWAGIYDIDRALVLELTDNRGNVAKGINGVEVANFDWGNAAYTGVRVDNATLTVTYGNARPITRVTVEGGSTLTLTGFLGDLTDVDVRGGSSVNLNTANGVWQRLVATGGASLNASGYTGGGTQTGNEVNAGALTFSGYTGALALTNVEFDNTTLTVAGAAAFTASGSALGAMSVTRAATGGAFTLTDSLLRAATINHTGAGTFSAVGSSVLDGTTITHTATAGNLGLTNSTLTRAAIINHAGNAGLSLTRSTVSDNADVTTDAGSSTLTALQNTVVEQASTVRRFAASSGPFNVIGTKVRASGTINHQTTGSLNIQSSAVLNNGTINLQSGTRNLSVQSVTVANFANIRSTGTGAGIVDNVIESEIANRASILFSCSGASNTFRYGSVRGINGIVTLSGTTGSQQMLRCEAYDGQITVTNTTVDVAALYLVARHLGGIAITGVTAAKVLNTINVTNGGTVTVNNSTGGGTVQQVSVSNGGNFVVSGAAGAAAGVEVHRGTLAFNGGSLTAVRKAGSGTLTTGAFAHSDISFQNAAAQTLLAANVSRQRDYINNTLL